MENSERNFNKIPENQRARKKEQFIACPTNGISCHKFEAEYWETYPGVWEMVPGTQKDLGPVEKTDKI